MATLTVTFSEKALAFIEAQVQKGQFGDAREYLVKLVEQEREREAERELETSILEALDEEAVPMTADDWAGIRREVERRREERRRSAARTA